MPQGERTSEATCPPFITAHDARWWEQPQVRRPLREANGPPLNSTQRRPFVVELAGGYSRRLKNRNATLDPSGGILRSMRPRKAIAFNVYLTPPGGQIPYCCQIKRAETAFSSPTGTSLSRSPSMSTLSKASLVFVSTSSSPSSLGTSAVRGTGRAISSSKDLIACLVHRPLPVRADSPRHPLQGTRVGGIDPELRKIRISPEPFSLKILVTRETMSFAVRACAMRILLI